MQNKLQELAYICIKSRLVTGLNKGGLLHWSSSKSCMLAANPRNEKRFLNIFRRNASCVNKQWPSSKQTPNVNVWKEHHWDPSPIPLES